MERVEVKDVRVPEQLQRAMAAEAEAAREARAKVIAAEGEHKASRALKHAAEIINDSPAALQVCKSRVYQALLKTSSVFSVEISPNSEQHICRKQQHSNLSCTNRSHIKHGVSNFSKKIQLIPAWRSG